VINKHWGTYTVLRSFGTGRSDKEVKLLESRAQEFILQQRGATVTLFSEEETVDLASFLSTLSNNQIQVVGPELIYGRLYDKVGYNAIKNDLFRHLVICCLFSPGSKLKTIDYLYRYQGVLYSTDKIYRFLDKLCKKCSTNDILSRSETVESETVEKDVTNAGAQDIKTEVERISFAHTKKVLRDKISVVFYDMTTLYFEASDEDDLRRTGFSKDGKHHCPQIFLGLLVASGGNPIGYEIFEGNICESSTFIPLLQRIEKRYNLCRPIVIADAGLLSDNNRSLLKENGYQYILGARIKNEKSDFKEKILSLRLKSGRSKTLLRDDQTRLILSMSDKRAIKDKHNREKGLARLEKRISSGKLTKSNINNRGYNKYLKLDGEIKVSINMEKFIADGAWDGLKGYITNTKLSPKKVIENYNNLWYIERAFRMNKTDLRIRPIYHHLRNRIEGHICICFTAYTILLEMERMLKKSKSTITIKRAQEITKNMYQLTYQLPKSNRTHSKILNMDHLQQELYDMVCRWVQ
jgi:transposase